MGDGTGGKEEETRISTSGVGGVRRNEIDWRKKGENWSESKPI